MPDENVVDRDDLPTAHAALIKLLLDIGVKSVFVEEETATILYKNFEEPMTVLL